MEFRQRIKIRRKERTLVGKKAENVLGFKWVKNLQLPDNQLDTVSLLSIVKEIEKVKIK